MGSFLVREPVEEKRLDRASTSPPSPRHPSPSHIMHRTCIQRWERIRDADAAPSSMAPLAVFLRERLFIRARCRATRHLHWPRAATRPPLGGFACRHGLFLIWGRAALPTRLHYALSVSFSFYHLVPSTITGAMQFSWLRRREGRPTGCSRCAQPPTTVLVLGAAPPPDDQARSHGPGLPSWRALRLRWRWL